MALSLLPPHLTGLPSEFHILVVGKTGAGKSQLLRALLNRDAETGKGVVLLDPHGDLAFDVVSDLPRHRKNDLVLLDPTRPDCRSINPFRGVDAIHRNLVVANVLAAIR